MAELTVKQLRLVKEKTQESCANALGIHVNTYRNLEEHPEKFTIQQAVMLCNFFRGRLQYGYFFAQNFYLM